MKRTIIIWCLMLTALTVLGQSSSQKSSSKWIASGTKDTTIRVNNHDMMLLIATYDRMIYLQNDRDFLLTQDSLNKSVIYNQATSLSLSSQNVKLKDDIIADRDAKIQEKDAVIKKEIRRKKAWKVTSIVGLPVSFLAGMLLVLL